MRRWHSGTTSLQLPAFRRYPIRHGLTSEALCAAASEDAPLEEVREMARLFAYLIPGLIVNVAYFRHQLLDDA